MAVYIDPQLVPFDDYSVPDIGDAHSLAGGELNSFKQIINGIDLGEAKIPNNHPKKVTPHLVVPYTRTIELGSTGRDVVGAKRAIWKANGLHVPVKATPMFGKTAVNQLKKFQHGHGLSADGVLGRATLEKLAIYFDQLAYFDYVGYPPGSSKQSRILAYAWWGYNNRGAIGYAQYRPMSYLWDLEHIPINEDCSTFTTKGFKFGGAQDPNRMSPPYNGYGNTGSQRQHGTIVHVADCLPADLAHYDNPQHVGIVVRGGTNAAVIELGSGIGPLYLGIYYRPLTFVMRYAL